MPNNKDTVEKCEHKKMDELVRDIHVVPPVKSRTRRLVEQFISTEMQSLAEEILGEIEKKKKEGNQVRNDGAIDTDISFVGGELAEYMLASTYNQALSDTQEKIKAIFKKRGV